MKRQVTVGLGLKGDRAGWEDGRKKEKTVRQKTEGPGKEYWPLGTLAFVGVAADLRRRKGGLA